MPISRRLFIRDGVATVTLGLAAPSFLGAIAQAQGLPSRRLVVVYLGGGNDAPLAAADVIAYSGRDDDATVKRAATAGASAYLSKDAPIPHVLDAIREAARGAPFRVWRATR